MLSFKEIKDLIDLAAERGLLTLEIEQTGFRIRIEAARAASNGTAPVTEPLPAPGALPAPTSGEVPKGKILCIIESMKLMNEIESDVEGEIVEVFPLNGQPVEYGEKLFAIRLAA